MSFSIDREIDRFQQLAAQLGQQFDTETPCEYGVIVRPRGTAVGLPRGKRVALALFGIVHGNEWAGLGVLNALMAHLIAGNLRLDVPLALVLGNPWAARENKRFLDRDLNRSFARSGPAREERRADVLAAVLRDSCYLVDFHQTTKKSEHPFFIFPFSRKSFDFARDIGPRHTIVTHWGKPFSTEGMCSDEYLNGQGGVGISLELGQNGFDAYQIGAGLDAALWAIRAVTGYLDGSGARTELRRGPGETGALYTWAEIMPWPEKGVVELDEWHNFRDVGVGQRVGTVDGAPIVAKSAGKILFPKYLTREQQAALESRPTELLRIMRPITEAELPSG